MERHFNVISTPRDTLLFDDAMYELCLEHAKSPETRKYMQWLRESLRGAGYAQSVYEPDQIFAQLDRFAEPSHPPFHWNRYYRRALKRMVKELSRFNLAPTFCISNEALAERLSSMDTHAGFIYLTDEVGGHRRSKGEWRDELVSLRDKALMDASEFGGNFSRPIMIASRTQAGNPIDEFNDYIMRPFKRKSRLVSMISLDVILVELEFSAAIQAALGTIGWYAGGKNNSSIYAWLRAHREKGGQHMLTIDYSSFDQTQSAWLIREAFELVKTMFRTLTPEEEVRYGYIVESYIHKWFIDPRTGHTVESRKGTPSGDMFTQIIDSVINRLMVLTYLEKIGIPNAEMMIMGDDNIIFTREPLDAGDLSGYLNANFGVETNASKMWQGHDVDPEFLSRYWRQEGVDRPNGLLLAKLWHPEKFIRYTEGKLEPKDKFLSYYMEYPVAMNRLFDMEGFFESKIPDADTSQKRSEAIAAGVAKVRQLERHFADLT